MHVGIYQELSLDAPSESKAAAMGGVTTSLNYFRTGQYYLNRGGPYRDFMPEVLRSEGNFWVDYGYHLAPIESRHIDEMDSLLTDWGVPSFKIFMFYGGYGLHGRSSDQNEFLMIGPDERYDIAHFEFIMRSARRMMEKHPETRRAHQRQPALRAGRDPQRLYQDRRARRQADRPGGLQRRAPAAFRGAGDLDRVLSRQRDQLPEHQSCCTFRSRKAIDAALMMQDVFPHINFRREVTIGHLLLDLDSECAVHAKVNPPIRPREDVEALWEAVLDRKVDWIVSDHACCATERKYSTKFPKDIWLAKAGFGGTEYLLSGVLSEGRKRGMSLNRMAELLSWNPSRRYGVLAKGDTRHRLRRGPCAGRSRRELRRARRRVGIRAGLHTVRRPGAHRPREEHLPARQADL